MHVLWGAPQSDVTYRLVTGKRRRGRELKLLCPVLVGQLTNTRLLGFTQLSSCLSMDDPQHDPNLCTNIPTPSASKWSHKIVEQAPVSSRLRDPDQGASYRSCARRLDCTSRPPYSNPKIKGKTKTKENMMSNFKCPVVLSNPNCMIFKSPEFSFSTIVNLMIKANRSETWYKSSLINGTDFRHSVALWVCAGPQDASSRQQLKHETEKQFGQANRAQCLPAEIARVRERASAKSPVDIDLIIWPPYSELS
ncbi:hypothetical protein RRG08_022411 [Elysia crispata]|uniref:Uncharacterized protein n=1 Tax=Elysia crispata TaxID=231223 RepID=A0AAE0Z1A8_9GAST|nr:hypothetical protein RRG08_022411 [Elysia crispata]